MNLQHRIDLLVELGEYISSKPEGWQAACERAGRENGWFIPEFIDHATKGIKEQFLRREHLEGWAHSVPMPAERPEPLMVGIVMAGNIPLVGFHDWLTVFITGHKALVKPSSKDQVLLKHLVETLGDWEPSLRTQTAFAEMLKGCDAYLATGSNNSARYFDYYFSKYPHIIRRNRTSAAILTGEESPDELRALADDVHLYFGLGCRNVTSLFVPDGYDFVPLLDAFRVYGWFADHHKFRNNYDYNLALHILNKKYYMTNGSLLLVEDPSLFSPISQLNYTFYSPGTDPAAGLKGSADLQCLVGRGYLPFGTAQQPSLTDYADGENTLQFLANL